MLLAWPAFGQQERITSFDSQVIIHTDGGLDVRETISVQAAGKSIRHGIYRDFPTKYKDRFGNLQEVGFSIVSLERDGRPEPYRTQMQLNGVRAYFGSPQQILASGEHTYVFEYTVNRELGFFPDHDELYWNVTGSGWDFPIDVVTATIIAPDQVRNSIRETEAYTGYAGERGRNFTSSQDSAGYPTFRAEDLRPHQGLTIVVTWPKGLIAEPTAQQKLAWFLHDNQAVAIGMIGLGVVLAYYLIVWSMVGRDPAPGTIVPLYEAPDNLSPAAARYLQHMRFDDKAFSALILSLAAKGYLKIRRDESLDYELLKNPDVTEAEKKLTPDEKLLARELFENCKNIYLSKENQPTLTRARKAINLSLQGTMENIYFVRNSKYMWPGVVLTLVAIGGLIIGSNGVGTFAALFMTVWLTGWTAAVVGMVTRACKAWISKGQSGQALSLTLFSLPFIGFECMGIWALFKLFKSAGVPIFLSVMVLIGCNVLFHFLLRRPTQAGRRLLDHIEGFKTFLSEVDGDRLKRMGSPGKSPQLFEKFLPYALAFDMEHMWAQQFSQTLAQAATGSSSSGTAYYLSWYSGNGLPGFSAQAFTDSFSSSFTSAVSSSSTPPSSSSGSGGGGSSGGGGGGGGGGGW